jgi:flagellar biosynthesis protein
MAALLMSVDLDREIPPTLYRAVAELLVWLYRMEKAQPKTQRQNGKQAE